MFTGIVEEMGRVAGIVDRGDSLRLTIESRKVPIDVAAGGSVAVNGCCLTVVAPTESTFDTEVMKETLDRTSLAQVRIGDHVNLERAVRAGGRLDGHIVQGHVDGVATVISRRASAHWEVVTLAVPSELARYLAVKGSVALDGTSLTVVDLLDHDQPQFTVSLIPTTLAGATLGVRQPGDPVNIEVDVIAKYVERLAS